jgi:hypothetical protein
MYLGNSPISASYLTDYFSGNNTTVTFTLSRAPVSASAVIITISGVKQAASTYGVSGTTLTFSAAPPAGTNNIEVLHLGVQPDTVVQPSYRTITEFTATSGQTTFSPASYTVGYIDVYRNGVKLGTADFTATNGTSVVLANACAVGDYVRFEGFLITSFNNSIANTNGAVGDSLIASVSASKLTGSRTLPNTVVPAGSVIQVVSNHFNNYQTSTLTTFVSITGSLTSITPISASSKILVSYAFNGLTSVQNASTATQQTHQIIDGSSNVVKSLFNGFIVGGNQTYGMMSISGSFLHSPSTTSAFTYQLQIRGDGANNGFQINNYASLNNVYSSITLMEIAQ